ncbi:MAG TPA: GNAT family N-acetyltransferase [Candidatus Aquicultor sp.]
MLITQATATDLEEILQLQKLAYVSEAEIYNDFAIDPLVQNLQDIQDDFKSQIILKAVIEDRIVGFVRAYQDVDTCHIGKLAVHPDFRDQGIGAELMCEIEAQFESTRRFELFTGHIPGESKP